MKANCWMGKRDVRVERVPDPQILNARDAIVKISSTAICGSDLHLYNGFVPTMEKGDILGHEFMGEVVDVGKGVRNLKVGDRVVVPFPIACGACSACQAKAYSVCENSNPNAWMAEKLWGHAPCGIFGYSHMLGGYAGGQAEYARVPFADVGPIKVPDGLTDEQVLFLSDILPTGYMGAELCDIKPGSVIAVWGCGPVGQFAIKSAFMLGAERVIAIDRFPYRLRMARERAGAETINYEEVNVLEALKEMTGGRGPDGCIDAVGLEAHGHAAMYAYDRTKQALMMETDRPLALREAIMACRNGGTVSVIGVYGGFVDKFPMGAVDAYAVRGEPLTSVVAMRHAWRAHYDFAVLTAEMPDDKRVVFKLSGYPDVPMVHGVFIASWALAAARVAGGTNAVLEIVERPWRGDPDLVYQVIV